MSRYDNFRACFASSILIQSPFLGGTKKYQILNVDDESEDLAGLPNPTKYEISFYHKSIYHEINFVGLKQTLKFTYPIQKKD